MNRGKFPQQPWSAASSGCWELGDLSEKTPPQPKKWQMLCAGRKACGKAWNSNFSWQRERLKGTWGCSRHVREGSAPLEGADPSVLSVTSLQPNATCATAPGVPDNGTAYTVCPQESPWLCSGFSPVSVRWGEVRWLTGIQEEVKFRRMTQNVSGKLALLLIASPFLPVPRR